MFPERQQTNHGEISQKFAKDLVSADFKYLVFYLDIRKNLSAKHLTSKPFSI